MVRKLHPNKYRKVVAPSEFRLGTDLIKLLQREQSKIKYDSVSI